MIHHRVLVLEMKRVTENSEADTLLRLKENPSPKHHHGLICDGPWISNPGGSQAPKSLHNSSSPMYLLGN